MTGAMRINLGAGNRIRDGWANHDLHKFRPEITVTHDLNQLPWPWASNSAAEIDATSVFEHLKPTLIEILDECWRILQPRGILHLKYPLDTGPFTHDDPTHRWFWSAKAIDYVDTSTKYGQEHPYYTKRKWKIKARNASARNFWAQMEPVK